MNLRMTIHERAVARTVSPDITVQKKKPQVLSVGELNPGLPRAITYMTGGNTNHYTNRDWLRGSCVPPRHSASLDDDSSLARWLGLYAITLALLIDDSLRITHVAGLISGGTDSLFG
jgi:hypothetical protein